MWVWVCVEKDGRLPSRAQAPAVILLFSRTPPCHRAPRHRTTPPYASTLPPAPPSNSQPVEFCRRGRNYVADEEQERRGGLFRRSTPGYATSLRRRGGGTPTVRNRLQPRGRGKVHRRPARRSRGNGCGWAPSVSSVREWTRNFGCWFRTCALCGTRADGRQSHGKAHPRLKSTGCLCSWNQKRRWRLTSKGSTLRVG